jgi:lysylphosphatidylglycerol synthetase-like protein (DUF2156 family)
MTTNTFFSSDKRVREECQRLVDAGWTVREGGKHTVLKSPSGRFKVSVPSTIFEGKSFQNFRSVVRRVERQEAEFVRGQHQAAAASAV